MSSGTARVERLEKIALVRFDRGARANAFSFAMMQELTEVARSFEREHELSVVVLTGADRIFSAGMDLSDPAFDRVHEMSLSERRELAEHGPRLARAWAAIEAPTIAAVEGACLAGGLALAAMCDFRVGGATARFGAPEVKVAHNMGWHSVPRLVALVGAQATRRLLMAGEEWSAEEARRLGFLDWAAPQGGAVEAALAHARRIASYPLVATRMIKRQIAAAAHASDWALSALDRDQQLAVWTSQEFAAARASFARDARGLSDLGQRPAR